MNSVVYVVMGEEVSTDHGSTFDIVSIHRDQFSAREASLDWQASNPSMDVYVDEWEVK